jgi:branched-chain amino acid transport system substrate-binding protein
MTTRHWFATILGLASAAIITGSALAQQQPIKIGFAIAQSGFMSAYDTPGFKAAVLKIDEINAAGGLLGRKIEYR